MTKMTTLVLLGLTCLAAMPAIAWAGYRDGMNLYQYVRSSPLKHVDPGGRATVLVHGIDGRGWYAQARAKIKTAQPKESVHSFRWPLSAPRTDISFEKEAIKLNAITLEATVNKVMDLFGRPQPVESTFFENALDVSADLLPIVTRTGPGRYEIDIRLFRALGLMEPYPEGKKIRIYAGMLFPNKEFAAGGALKRTLENAKLAAAKEVETGCKVRVLAYSSGARVLSWAFLAGAPAADVAVVAGGSTSRWNPLISIRAKRTVNYFSRADFMTRYFPLGGGAGTYGMLLAENKGVPGVFHGDWMKPDLLDRYVRDLFK